MDERLRERLKELFSRLKRQIILLDGQGHDLLSDGANTYSLPEDLTAGVPVQIGRHLYMRSGVLERSTWMTEAEGGEDPLIMAEALLSDLVELYPEAGGAEYVYRQLLLDGPAGLETAIREHGIRERLERCVLVMEPDAPWHGDFPAAVRSILPAGPSDVVVAVGRQTVAYLMDMTAVDDRADLLDYASAAQESALSESGCALRIGIGGCAADAAGLHTSYDQACQALKVGRTYQPKRTVHDYQSLLMPRFLSELPPELALRYHRQLFSPETSRLLSEELLETASTFFDKDLNLSDTARQLYIHRNTLTYRLDKIMKITGLDLRHFDDAVTFRMLLEMKKCNGPDPE